MSSFECEFLIWPEIRASIQTSQSPVRDSFLCAADCATIIIIISLDFVATLIWQSQQQQQQKSKKKGHEIVVFCPESVVAGH